MKKDVITLSALLLSTLAFSQVGINTPDPRASLDITAKNATGTTRTAEGLLIPRVDRQRAQSMTGVETSTLIYVNNIATGTATGIAANINTVGYYYYDGTRWMKLKEDTSLYNVNGALTNNRTIAQGTNTLAFTSTATTGTDHFSVDGNTFSIDAANNRVGLGTTNPKAKIDVIGTLGIRSGETSGSWDNLWFNANGNDASINASGAENGLKFNVGNNGKGTYGDDQTLTTVATMMPNGNIGIGTTAPSEKLEIGGAISFNGKTIADKTSAGSIDYGLQQTRILSWGSDSSTNGVISFWTGRANSSTFEKMRIHSNGNVGIGTTNPTTKLDIAGSVKITDGTQGNNKVLTSDANGLATWRDLPAVTDTSIYANNGTLTGNRTVAQGVNTLAFTSTATTGTNHFSVDGTTFSVNTVNDRVGIGTNAPTHRLHVNGAIKIEDGTQGNNKVLTSDANGLATWKDLPATTDTSIYANNGTLAGNRTVAQGANTLAFTSTAANAFSVDGTTFSVNAANDRVGIGTNAPNSTFQVVGGEVRIGGPSSQTGTTANPLLRIHSNANIDGSGGEIRFNENDSNYGYFIKHNTNAGTVNGNEGLAIGKLPLSNITKPGVFIAENQNIGLGTSTPQQMFHIDGGKDNNILVAPSETQQANDLVLTSEGRMGIGTTTPSTKLHINSAANGAVRIVDGTQGNNKVLTSDANGLATWKDLPATTDTSIYANNGTLAGNRTVAQGANTLAFTSTAANAFSVDGTTFSVNAANDRVGIGTNTPAAKLHVNGNVVVGSATSTSGGTGYSTVVRDNTTGELKIAESSTGNTTPINYITYTLSNVNGDWINDYDTKINTTDYTVVVTGSSYTNAKNALTAVNGDFNPVNVYAYKSRSTWRLYADYVNAGSFEGSNGTWTFYCLVINNTIVKTLAGISQDLGGSNNGVAASSPPGL